MQGDGLICEQLSFLDIRRKEMPGMTFYAKLRGLSRPNRGEKKFYTRKLPIARNIAGGSSSSWQGAPRAPARAGTRYVRRDGGRTGGRTDVYTCILQYDAVEA